jgi:hypothetical protein
MVVKTIKVRMNLSFSGLQARWEFVTPDAILSNNKHMKQERYENIAKAPESGTAWL